MQLLEIVGDDHGGHALVRCSNAYGAVDAGAYLGGNCGRDDVLGHIREKVLEIDLLLIAGAEGFAALLTDNRHHWDVVGLGIVKTRQQVDRARTGRRIAKAHLTGELGVRRSHEGSHLFVAHLHVVHELLGLLQRDIKAADAVARIAVDAAETPLVKSIPDELGYVLRHRSSPWSAEVGMAHGATRADKVALRLGVDPQCSTRPIVASS